MRVDFTSRQVAIPLGLVWLAALAVGLVGVAQRFLTGHEQADYGSYIPWGLWVGMYIFLAGLSAGLFLIASLDILLKLKAFAGTARMLLLATLVTLGAGLLFIWLDLGHPERVWRVYTNPNFNSVMAQIVWAYTAFGVLTLLALLLLLRNARDPLLSIVMAVGIPLALFLSSAVGALLGVAAARPFWHVGLFPIQFPVFSVASAAALLLVMVALFGPRESSQRRQLLWTLALTSVVLQAVKLFFLWADLSQSYYGGAPQNEEAIEALLFGRYWWAFWFLQIVIGSVLPVAVLIQPRLARRPAWALAAGAMILGGLVVARMNILLPALVVPQLEELEAAYVNPHLSLDYFPSVMEWQVFVFILALAVGAFLLVYRLIPSATWEEADT